MGIPYKCAECAKDFCGRRGQQYCSRRCVTITRNRRRRGEKRKQYRGIGPRKFPKEYDASSRLYRAHRNMLNRCLNESDRAFKWYGARGITVCNDWLSYASFLEWAQASGYVDGLTIERDDVNDDYKPSNCKWIPLAEQSSNRRNVPKLAAFGEIKTVKQWSEDARCKVGYRTLFGRLKAGRSLEWALSAPLHSGRRPNGKNYLPIYSSVVPEPIAQRSGLVFCCSTCGRWGRPDVMVAVGLGFICNSCTTAVVEASLNTEKLS